MYTIQYCQVQKAGEARNDHKVKTGCFWSNILHNNFTQKLIPEAQFESSDDESDTKYDKDKNTNIKEGGNYGNRQVDDTDVETVDLTWDDAPQDFVS